MREILYLQSGNFSNFIGTHFWNTQEEYLSSDVSEPLTDASVSFREEERNGGIDYTPRLLIFDFKSNFGAFARSNLLNPLNDDSTDSEALWQGTLQKTAQPPVPESAYLQSLNQNSNSQAIIPSDIRYWSDFNRLYHHRETLQPLPDRPEWSQDDNLTWQEGKDMFSTFDKDCELLDGSVRRFLEECDSPQGVHCLTDSSSFGAFTHTFLTSFRDEHPKLALLSLPSMSIQFDAGIENIHRIIQDALLLQKLSEISTLTVPLSPPSASWASGIEVNSRYQSSSIVASHIESVTLPTRLAKGYSHFSDYLLQVTTSLPSSARIAHVAGGNLEADVPFDFSTSKLFDLSLLQYGRHDVLRGLPASSPTYENWTINSHLNGFSTTSTIPPTDHHPSFSSLTSTSSSALYLSAYVRMGEKVLREPGVLNVLGMDGDEVKELVEELWAMHDTIVDDRAEDLKAKEDSFGEDET
ncbi:Misato segment II tubulin-like domain-containing protein [Flagelloscypha sp. PMI_526]|nr:Misato segment II tubulin-like domain-containing protein [Flagelloscypha sp. PMI_526]